VVLLWTLGLASGAIHPLGFIVALMELAASIWLIAVFGALGAIQAEKAEGAAAQGLHLTLLLTCTGVLPLLLPAGFNSVLLASGSLPFMVWTSLLSYRDLARALASPLTGNGWTGLRGGQVPLVVFASWLLAMVGPALGGTWAWRYGMRHFDRLVGRPHRPAPAANVDIAPRVPTPSFPGAGAALSSRGSPLAEADGAV
jgi:hypothetical protein